MLLIRFLSHPTTNRSTTRKLLTIKGVNTDYYDRHRPSVKVAATAAAVVVVSTFGAAAATTTTTTTNNSGTKKTICNGKVPSPPRFGKSIPHDLVVDLKNNSKRRRNETHHYARFTTSSSLSENINSTNNSDTDRISSSSSSNSTSSSSSSPPNKSNCPLCQKYSQGPCGDLFQKWMDCIDSHPPGNQAECDSWMVPLDQCLKEHVEYYDSIQTIDPENDIDKDDTDKWRDFLKELDQEQEEAAGEGSIDTRDFPKEYEPQMELRPKDQTGFAMFCPRVQQDRQLLLAYIQDQDGNVLGAGSVEDLYLYQPQSQQQPQQSQQDEYYYVLRFAVTNQDCQSVTAYGLYACEDEEEEEEEEEHGDDTNDNKKKEEEKTSSSCCYIRYTKTERIPKDYFHQSYK